MNRPILDRETLLAYIGGQLGDEESERLAELIDSDPEAQALLETLDIPDDTLAANLQANKGLQGDEGQGDEPLEHESDLDAVLDRLGAAGGSNPNYLPKGTMLGEYELTGRLGRGGMGTVYRARHTKLGREVALKVISEHRINDPGTLARFAREMQAIGRLEHPAIVRAFDAREIDSRPVLVMELIDGIDLSRLVRRHGPVRLADACEMIRQAAIGLQYAHEHSLVHRDIKPSNLMLQRDGTVKILDLGLARADIEFFDNENSLADPDLTGTHVALGTADYIAPEQADDPTRVDIRADIYSIGCTLFKLLTGRAPFAMENTLDKLAAHSERPIPEIQGIPEQVMEIIYQMTAKSLSHRFAQPNDVIEAIKPFCEGHDLVTLLENAEKMTGPPAIALHPATVGGGGFRRFLRTACAAFFFGGFGLLFGILITIERNDEKITLQIPDKTDTQKISSTATTPVPAKTMARLTFNDELSQLDLGGEFLSDKAKAMIYKSRCEALDNNLATRLGVLAKEAKKQKDKNVPYEGSATQLILETNQKIRIVQLHISAVEEYLDKLNKKTKQKLNQSTYPSDWKPTQNRPWVQNHGTYTIQPQQPKPSIYPSRPSQRTAPKSEKKPSAVIPKEQDKALLGRWHFIEHRGELSLLGLQGNPENIRNIIFHKDRPFSTQTTSGKAEIWDWNTVAKASPKKIVMHITSFNRGTIKTNLQGIYKIDGDRLTVRLKKETDKQKIDFDKPLGDGILEMTLYRNTDPPNTISVQIPSINLPTPKDGDSQVVLYQSMLRNFGHELHNPDINFCLRPNSDARLSHVLQVLREIKSRPRKNPVECKPRGPIRPGLNICGALDRQVVPKQTYQALVRLSQWPHYDQTLSFMLQNRVKGIKKTTVLMVQNHDNKQKKTVDLVIVSLEEGVTLDDSLREKIRYSLEAISVETRREINLDMFDIVDWNELDQFSSIDQSKLMPGGSFDFGKSWTCWIWNSRKLLDFTNIPISLDVHTFTTTIFLDKDGWLGQEPAISLYPGPTVAKSCIDSWIDGVELIEDKKLGQKFVRLSFKKKELPAWHQWCKKHKGQYHT
jgi:serine/threonine protein kinase